MVGYWPSSFLCVYASDKSSYAQLPPPGYWGTFAYLVSLGGGALSNFAWPGGSGICPPRAFDTYYVDFDSNITKRGGFYGKHINKPIGSFIKDAKNV